MGKENRIALTKNGYDILRIAQLNSDNYNCSFKIVPMVDNYSFKITTTKMYSLPEEVIFDKGKNIEITYHKDDGIHGPTIHIKMIDKTDGSTLYKSLPLKEIVYPNVKTKIPVPFLKVVVPDSVLSKRYNSSTKKKQFDIGENNVTEIFLINNISYISDFSRDFPFIFQTLFDENFEFFTSGVARGKNIENVFKEIKGREVKNFMFGAQVTKDVAIWIVNTFDRSVNTDKLELNFIENKFYLPLTIDRITISRGERELIYMSDLRYNVMFSSEMKMKYKIWFERQIIELRKYAASHYGSYIKICNYYDNLDLNKIV